MTSQQIKRLGEKIKHLNYVVQRNWDNLPESLRVGEHDDLDLFVSEDDKDELEYIISDYDLVDCRSLKDLYYPPKISDLMLLGRRYYNGFWIPSEKAHFLSLYYHDLVHKGGGKYTNKLEEIFKEWCPPIKCKDEGVGFFV